ncbi:rCG25068, partial [Rattus norvegicus]
MTVSDIMGFCEAMTNDSKIMVVDTLKETFQSNVFCSTLKLVLAKSCLTMASMCLECFPEAAYTKWLGLRKKVGVISTKPKATPCTASATFRSLLSSPLCLESHGRSLVPGSSPP